MLALVAFLSSCRSQHAQIQARETSQDFESVTISISDYRNKLEGSLVGQLFGLAWGFAGGIEFRYRRRIVPRDALADWRREVDIHTALRAPAGDDFYCEFSALRAMADHGPRVTWEQMTPYYRDTGYPLWHSDRAMRDNLRRGVRAPKCGHYKALLANATHGHSDDLDAQMQVDFCGTTNPGNPRAAIAQAWKFGHMMNYGDGAIGAAVIAAMNAEAFVPTDVAQIVRVGVAAAPEGSKYRALLDDVVAWHKRWPEDWKQTWRALDAKWGDGDRCPQAQGDFNIDAKLHGGFILIGLLYGKGDFIRSLELTIRCGQDTDTSAQNLGSILGAFLGARALPQEVVTSLRRDSKIEGASMSYDDASRLIERLARKSVDLSGGRVRGRGVDEAWSILRRPVIAPILEQWPERANDAPSLEVNHEHEHERAVNSGRRMRTWERVQLRQRREVNFAAKAEDDDGILAYQWHFGDLEYANGARVKHRFRRPGTYEVVCYVADRLGNTSIRRLTLRID